MRRKVIEHGQYLPPPFVCVVCMHICMYVCVCVCM
jgi:hypothetical protein